MYYDVMVPKPGLHAEHGSYVLLLNLLLILCINTNAHSYLGKNITIELKKTKSGTTGCSK